MIKTSAFSSVVHVTVRPFHAYGELAKSPPSLAEGLARFLFVLGALVAFTATGRLQPIELAAAALSFAWIPLVQAAAFGVALCVGGVRVPLRRGFALYLAGHGPWLLLFVGIVAYCFFAPDPSRVSTNVLRPVAMWTLGWSALLTFACFLRGVALPLLRALAATLVFYVVSAAVVLGYFTLAGQLLPIL